LLIVLDRNYQVYVSSRPRELGSSTSLRGYGAEMARLEAEISRLSGDLKPRSYEHPEDQNLYVIMPMLSDGVGVGTLIVGYDRDIFWPRFKSILERVVISALIAMLLLMPVGWYFANRIVQPLAQLSACMAKVGSEKTEDIVCDLAQGNDEIGQLVESFTLMLQELSEKEKLELNMLASERLAAVGRLTAGVAHEINNPLGGMLNALNTFKKYGHMDELGRDTIMLVERGLGHIRETVSALLVEARSQSHDLSTEDIDDVHTLLLPSTKAKQIDLVWKNRLDRVVSLPSTPVRQILMNLSLNAIQACEENTAVMCLVALHDDRLLIEVENQGEEIPRHRMMQLFEPFAEGARGSGLGLWVTYQLVQQLDGSIEVRSQNRTTSFSVEFRIGAVA
jgi:signal transduction histidine kinase